MTIQKEISNRAYIVLAAVCLLGLAVIARIFIIQFTQDEKWEKKANEFTDVIREIQPTRGQIFSDDGSLLATSVPIFSYYWDSQCEGIDMDLFKSKLDSLSFCFAHLFKDKTQQEYKQIFLSAIKNNHRFALIKNKIDYNQRQQVRNFPVISSGRFKSGFIEHREQIRKKPFDKLASRTIGIERDNSRVGLELAYNKELAGTKGKQIQKKIAGNIWLPVTDDYIIEPEEGCDLYSAIDIHLQDVASNALENQLKHHGADWGVAILMEVETGYIKAIANLSLGKDQRYHESLNLAIAQSVEPGSTFKLASIMALLDDGHVSLNDSINTGNGAHRFHDRLMKDSNHDHGGNGVLSVEQVFEKSSNIGTALLVDKYYGKNPQAFLNKLETFGLNQALGLSIKGEVAPKIYHNTNEEGWSGISLTQMAIGYEIKQTPLQTLSLYNALANNGRLMKPLFAYEIKKNGITYKRIEPQAIKERICSAETIKECQKMMIGVSQAGGTADYIFAKSPYTVAGKTGTARLYSNGAYQSGQYRASFVGYFPSDAPKYSCIVVVNKPTSGAYYGSTLAAPVFKEIADHIYATEIALTHNRNAEEAKIRLMPVAKNGHHGDLSKTYSYLGIEKIEHSNNDWVNVSTHDDHVELKDKKITANLVPNVLGMGLQDAIYLMEESGLRVKIVGSGTVKKQSVQAGARLSSNQTITLELS